VMRRARSLGYVQEATIFGNSVHLLVPDAKTHDDLVRDLTESGVNVTIRPIPPSLEDVFVRLTAIQAEAENGGVQDGRKP
jgi:drug efflux transport system permease protein/drug efflux transport system ATP-binding protein